MTVTMMKVLEDGAGNGGGGVMTVEVAVKGGDSAGGRCGRDDNDNCGGLVVTVGWWRWQR